MRFLPCVCQYGDPGLKNLNVTYFTSNERFKWVHVYNGNDLSLPDLDCRGGEYSRKVQEPTIQMESVLIIQNGSDTLKAHIHNNRKVAEGMKPD
ncbi:hypothetical protein PATA110616_14535 [Paenibacillus tarimensis]